jgi:hypothetical protein
MCPDIRHLIGKSIRSISLSKPAFDLRLEFSNRLVLRIFCDSINESEMLDNYSIFLPDIIYLNPRIRIMRN